MIIQRRRSEVRVARIDGWAAGEQPVGEGWAAVVLERAEQWIGVDLIAAAIQETAAIIAAEVVAARSDRA